MAKKTQQAKFRRAAKKCSKTARRKRKRSKFQACMRKELKK